MPVNKLAVLELMWSQNIIHKNSTMTYVCLEFNNRTVALECGDLNVRTGEELWCVRVWKCQGTESQDHQQIKVMAFLNTVFYVI
jgi:hypothetical protein